MKVIINGDHMNIKNEVPERTLIVDSKELKRAAEGKCLTKGNVCRIPFKAINNSTNKHKNKNELSIITKEKY